MTDRLSVSLPPKIREQVINTAKTLTISEAAVIRLVLMKHYNIKESK